MGRPPLPIGAHGNIHTKPVSGGVEASCWFRGADGSRRRIRRVRSTKTAAVNAVKEAVVILAKQARGGQITPETRLRVIAERWYADEILLAVAEGRKAPKTAYIYRSYLDVHIVPALGERRALEVKTPECAGLITAKRREGAKDDKLAGIRNVLNGVCSFAVRLGAMDVNPMREVGRFERAEPPKPPRALTAAERVDVLAKLDADPKARERDLADVLRAMLATGKRVAEILGCDGDDVLLDDTAKPRLRVAHRTTRIKGQGIVRRAMRGGPKGKPQILRIPGWSVPGFRARKLASGGRGPLFPDPFGGWRSNDSVITPLRHALDRAGYGWLTSHGMRDTVANFLRDAGIALEDIAAQLGNTPPIAKKHYLEEIASNDDQVQVLEGMM